MGMNTTQTARFFLDQYPRGVYHVVDAATHTKVTKGTKDKSKAVAWRDKLEEDAYIPPVLRPAYPWGFRAGACE